MNISTLSSIFLDKEQYSLSTLVEILSPIPFINSFINLNGKEELPSLLNLIVFRNLSPKETFKITNSSSSFFVYLKGNIEFINTSNGNVIEKDIEVGTPMFYSRKALYDQITVKINSPSLFLELNTNEYNVLLNSIFNAKTQRLQRFILTLKAFPYFQRLKKVIYERLFRISEEKTYKKKEVVYEENTLVDGIYLIIKGSFLLSKKQPLLNKEEELKRLDKEIRHLSKEGVLLMKCLNGKYGLNAKTMNGFRCRMKHDHFEKDHDSNIITKNSDSNVYLTIMNENNIFGDFELITKETKRSYTVQCSTDIGKVIYFPQSKFLEICNESLISKINDVVIKKAKLMNAKYYSDISIAEKKCQVNNMVNLPNTTEGFWLDRNNHDKTRNNLNVVRSINAIHTNINLHHFDEFIKKNNHLSKTKEMKNCSSKYNMSNSFKRIHHDLIKTFNNQTKLAHFFHIKTASENSKSFALRTSSSNNQENTGNISQYTQKSNYYPLELNQNYLTTGIKYPSSIAHYKKKMIFHFNDKKSNLKRLILKNNLREITLSIRQ